jgi:serine protease Do
MKRSIALGIIGWFIATLGSIKATAQDTPPAPPPPPAISQKNQKESQEIIIRKKGDKDTKLTVEIADGKVMINGKPLAEFNEDGVTINNRKMIVRDGNKVMMDINGKMTDLNDLTKTFNLDRMKDIDFNFDDHDFAWGGDTKEYTYLGVSTTKADDGVKVTNVTKDSPADKAGIQKDDVIYKIDDTKIDETSALSEAIRAKKDGEKVKVYYLRDGKKKDAKATLSTTKSVLSRSFTYTGPDGIKSLTFPRTPRTPGAPRVYGNGNFNSDFNDVQIFSRRQKLGLKIQDTEEGTGVKVLDVEAASAAATAGLMKDDVITEIGGVKVTNTDEARTQLQENKDKNTYAVKAKRNGSEMNFTIKIPKNLKTANL